MVKLIFEARKQIGTTVESFYAVFSTKKYRHCDFMLVTIQLIMRAL